MKKAIDFPVGTKVCDFKDKSYKGRVISNSLHGDSVVIVEWNNGVISKFDVLHLEVIDSKLEAEFAKMNAHLADAAFSLQEAVDIATRNNMTFDVIRWGTDLDLKPFFQSVRNAGWNPSSWDC